MDHEDENRSAQLIAYLLIGLAFEIILLLALAASTWG